MTHPTARPVPTVSGSEEASEPITWCRIFQQRVCPHPCVDCKRDDANYTADDRRRILEGVRSE